MKAKAIVIFSACLIAAISGGLAGCGSQGGETAAESGATSAVSSTASDSSGSVSSSAPVSNFSAENAIKIEDIDWTIKEIVLNGNKYVSLDYTNNSKYPITYFEIHAVPKEDFKKEDLAKYKEIRRWYKSYSDEDFIDALYFQGYTYKIVDPGETTKNNTCAINARYCTSIKQYELMEPDTATISIIGDDNKIHTVGYSFSAGTYTEDTDKIQDLYSLSDNKLLENIPTDSFKVNEIVVEGDDYIHFNTYGFKKEDYDDYVSELKKEGFKKDAEFDDSFYGIKKDIKVNVDYNDDREMLDINIHIIEDDD